MGVLRRVPGARAGRFFPRPGRRGGRFSHPSLAATPAFHALGEYARTHCAVPAQFQIEDGVYTMGRGATFSVRAPSAKPDQRTDFGFWVAWTDP
jgi:hypothetical protein